jgi:hypothetical protein
VLVGGRDWVGASVTSMGLLDDPFPLVAATEVSSRKKSDGGGLLQPRKIIISKKNKVKDKKIFKKAVFLMFHPLYYFINSPKKGVIS